MPDTGIDNNPGRQNPNNRRGSRDGALNVTPTNIRIECEHEEAALYDVSTGVTRTAGAAHMTAEEQEKFRRSFFLRKKTVPPHLLLLTD